MIKQICRSSAIAWSLSLSLLNTSATALTTKEEVPEGTPNNQSIRIAPNAQNSDDPFDFSSDGRSGRRTGGGSRSECPSLNPPLTALVPSHNSGTTVSGYPTFWFYVPYASAQSPIGELVLQNEQRDDILRRSFVLPETPGLVSVTVPESEAALAVDEWYLWYFNLYCDPDQNAPPVFTQGWIKRVALEDEGLIDEFDGRLDQYYTREGIWFDALNELAILRGDRPSDPELLNDWQTLMNAPSIAIELPAPEFAGAVEFKVPEQAGL